MPKWSERIPATGVTDAAVRRLGEKPFPRNKFLPSSLAADSAVVFDDPDVRRPKLTPSSLGHRVGDLSIGWVGSARLQ
jgi:hypothetical protein